MTPISIITITFYDWLFKSFTLYLFLIQINCSIAQTDSSEKLKNVIFIELGGPGGYGSINYERTLLKQKKLSLHGRLGISTVHLKNHERKLSPDLIIPLTMHICYGNSHKVEIGFGETFTYMNVVNFDSFKTKRNSYLHTAISLGYRYQPIKSRIFTRLTYSPVFERNKQFRHWGGVSLGYQF